jgi:hypothetical protein
MPSEEFTATNIGLSAVNPIGRKSRGSFNGRFSATVSSATNVDRAGMKSV